MEMTRMPRKSAEPEQAKKGQRHGTPQQKPPPSAFPPERTRKAVHAFSTGMSEAEQRTLAEELVETRETELRRAYPELIRLMVGYRTKRRGKAGRIEVIPQICIVFFVKRKWKPEDFRAERALPRHLYAYCIAKGVR